MDKAESKDYKSRRFGLALAVLAAVYIAAVIVFIVVY